MNLLKKIGPFIFVALLASCSGSDTASSVQQEKKTSAGEKKDFLFKDMKDSMDEAKSVKELMQKHHETQQQKLNKP